MRNNRTLVVSSGMETGHRGLLLRAVREDSELDYVTLDAPRRRARAG